MVENNRLNRYPLGEESLPAAMLRLLGTPGASEVQRSGRHDRVLRVRGARRVIGTVLTGAAVAVMAPTVSGSEADRGPSVEVACASDLLNDRSNYHDALMAAEACVPPHLDINSLILGDIADEALEIARSED